MTIPEFELAALKGMRGIQGATRLIAEVTPSSVHAGCVIGGKKYELSFAYSPDDPASRERAFAHVLRGVKNARSQFYASRLSGA